MTKPTPEQLAEWKAGRDRNESMVWFDDPAELPGGTLVFASALIIHMPSDLWRGGSFTLPQSQKIVSWEARSERLAELRTELDRRLPPTKGPE
jgi:hypothetical protein